MIRKSVVVIIILLFTLQIAKSQSMEQLFKNNNKNSFETILKAAKKGNIEAAYYVGLSYEIGQGVKLNYKKAFIWYKKAANAGWNRAQYNLAFLYKYGYGTKKNMIQSYKWFYISGHIYECDLDAQQMSQKEVEKAVAEALEWEQNYNG